MASLLPLPRGPGGNWGALRPLHWSARHFGLGSKSSRHRELWKELNSCLPPLHPPTFPHHPAKPGSLLGHGIAVLRCYATGLGSQGPGAHNCIWFVRLGGYINIMSPLITSGSSVPPCYTEDESVRWRKTKKKKQRVWNLCTYMCVNQSLSKLAIDHEAGVLHESNKWVNWKWVAWKCVDGWRPQLWLVGVKGEGKEGESGVRFEQNFSLSIPNQAPTTLYYPQGLSSHSVGGWQQFLCDKGRDCLGKCSAWLHTVMPHKRRCRAEWCLSPFYKHMTNSPKLVLCRIRRGLEMLLQVFFIIMSHK